MDKSSLEKCTDELSQQFWNNQNIREKLNNTVPLKDIHAATIYGVYLVGGHGPMVDLYDCKELTILVENVYLKGGILGAVCHGPVGLLCAKYHGAPLLKDKEVTAWSNNEEKQVGWDKCLPFLLENKLREIGAEVKLAEPYQPNVVISDRIITGQNFASAQLLGEKMAHMLNDFWPSYLEKQTLQVGTYAPGIEHKPGVAPIFREHAVEHQPHGESASLPSDWSQVSQQPQKGVDVVNKPKLPQQPGYSEELNKRH